ncbi:unnamed protein product [Arctia plantaginis]|uniref:Uncharacterized protein n=1 Tax=Arctia plantaginis TaxID=874455 RepID=A0A8S0YSK6_ARCPL|nr:unnamed protein product [Arctia plantaginis]
MSKNCKVTLEIEAIEEQWRTESAELVTAVARLQDENKRLRRTINAPADGTSAPPSPAREHDQEVLSRLSSTAEKQRATLRNQESQLQEKQQLIDSKKGKKGAFMGGGSHPCTRLPPTP